MKFKKMIFVLSITTFVIFLGMFGTSYAYYVSSGGPNLSDSTPDFNPNVAVVFDQSEYINVKSAIPIQASDVDRYANKSTFTLIPDANILNNGQVAVNISLVDVYIDNALKISNFKYKLVCDDGTSSRTLASGTGANITSNTLDLGGMNTTDGNFSVNKQYACTFSVWLQESGSDQNNLMNKKFSGLLKVGTMFKGSKAPTNAATETLTRLKLKVDTAHTPDFTTCSGNSCMYYDDSTGDETSGHGDGTNGIYSARDDLGTSYYFRGAVNNNYVSFAGKTWRIVRINGDGTIRIALNGSAGTSAFNVDCYDNACVGYMYGTPGSSTYEATHANTNNSTIKTFLDNWYDTNLSSYSSYIADSIFCNDRSISNSSDYWGETTTNTGIGTAVTAYSGYKRTYVDHNPSLICPNNNDKFTVSSSIGNGALTKPIGLLTIDEYIMAGAGLWDAPTNNGYYYDSSAGAFYLYDNSKSYWSMSPDGYGGGGAYASDVLRGGNANFSFDGSNDAVRPAVSLKSNAIIGGTGTSSDPFTVG